MRIIGKIFGFAVSLIVITMIMFTFVTFNVSQDELNNIVTTAMTSTQILIKEQMEDEAYGTDNKRYAITSNQQYLDEYKKNLDRLKTSDNRYEIKVYGIDYRKGLLDIEVTSTVRMWNGSEKKFSTRKTGLVEQLQQ